MAAVEMKLTGIDGVLETLKRLPPEVVSKRGGPVRAALRKGAMVIVKQARSNFRDAVDLPGKTGITDSTGFTEKQIVAKRKRPPPGVNGGKYIVTVNYVDHPSGLLSRRKSRAAAGSKRKARKRTPKPIKANDIAFIMEVGSSKQPATPWLRPAFNAKAAEAINVIQTELLRRVNLIVAKLAAQNKGK